MAAVESDAVEPYIQSCGNTLVAIHREDFDVLSYRINLVKNVFVRSIGIINNKHFLDIRSIRADVLSDAVIGVINDYTAGGLHPSFSSL